jgi:hypothetical protein
MLAHEAKLVAVTEIDSGSRTLGALAAISSAKASGAGQVSGLRIHTPSQPRSGRNSRSHELTPPGKPRFSFS